MKKFLRNSLPTVRETIIWLKSREPSAQISFTTSKGEVIDSRYLVVVLCRIFRIEDGGVSIISPPQPQNHDYSLMGSVYLGSNEEQKPIRDEHGNFTDFGREQVMLGHYLCSKLDDLPSRTSRRVSDEIQILATILYGISWCIEKISGRKISLRKYSSASFLRDIIWWIGILILLLVIYTIVYSIVGTPHSRRI